MINRGSVSTCCQSYWVVGAWGHNPDPICMKCWKKCATQQKCESCRQNNILCDANYWENVGFLTRIKLWLVEKGYKITWI